MSTEQATEIFLLEQENRKLRDELSGRGVHTCHDQCQRVACVQRREIVRLRVALSSVRNAAAFSSNLRHATGEIVRLVDAALGADDGQ